MHSGFFGRDLDVLDLRSLPHHVGITLRAARRRHICLATRDPPRSPVVGGLFLAFPAIFPASATLIEKHGRERKEKAGLAGARRCKRRTIHASNATTRVAWARFTLVPLNLNRVSRDFC